MRPRPAHNGDGGGLYDLTKHRDSPMATRSVGPGSAAAAKPPPGSHGGGRGGGGEMNFNLYGYMPYNPVYISHEKLNHALTSPAAKDDVPPRPPARQVDHS